jgi:hypothetical protein
MREYIITLYNYEDLDSFYQDMETEGGNLYIPNRAVEVSNRRPVSRNTHYLLTEFEAEQIRNDSRVMNVELSPAELNLRYTPHWDQTSSFWNKSTVLNQNHKNWGLLRCIEGVQRSNWGSAGTPTVTGSVKTTSSGRNVDIVIVDGLIDPSHPEFAVNPDGSGGSRVVQYNWFQLNPQVTGDPAGIYVYTPYVDLGDLNLTSDNDHGCHVAGIVAGNTNGWARDANIYNISPYSTAPSFTFYVLDYIKTWHRSKPINPLTGTRNPTITNHSYGISDFIPIDEILTVRFLGDFYSGPFTEVDLLNFGIFSTNGVAEIPYKSFAEEQDMIDLINAGVIVVGSAGNESSSIHYPVVSVAETANPYNNYIEDIYNDFYYYNRGSSAASQGVICVGAISATFVDDGKAGYSNCGPRVDLYAPGSSIISSVNSSQGTTVGDIRNPTYRLTKKSGTSMSSPQVTGVIACAAEQWPGIKQSQALAYLVQHAKSNQIYDTQGPPSDTYSLQGSPNRYLYYYKDRPETGQIGPEINLGARPQSGLVWPRAKKRKTGIPPSISGQASPLSPAPISIPTINTWRSA